MLSRDCRPDDSQVKSNTIATGALPKMEKIPSSQGPKSKQKASTLNVKEEEEVYTDPSSPE